MQLFFFKCCTAKIYTPTNVDVPSTLCTTTHKTGKFFREFGRCMWNNSTRHNRPHRCNNMNFSSKIVFNVFSNYTKFMAIYHNFSKVYALIVTLNHNSATLDRDLSRYLYLKQRKMDIQLLLFSHFVRNYYRTQGIGRTRNASSSANFTTNERKKILQTLTTNLIDRLDYDSETQEHLFPLLVDQNIDPDLLELTHSCIIPE